MNTLTQKGEKTSYKKLFPPSNTPSLSIYTWGDGGLGEKEGEEDRENANCREMEKAAEYLKEDGCGEEYQERKKHLEDAI